MFPLVVRFFVISLSVLIAWGIRGAEGEEPQQPESLTQSQ